MQPYIFPYLGYFHLIYAADHFVFLDHVNFIKKGWINRNRVRNSQGEILFSIPLYKASQNRAINETMLSEEYDKWRNKFLKQLELSYKKAPNFEAIHKLIENTLDVPEGYNISELAIDSVQNILKYLEIKREISLSSNYDVQAFRGQEMIMSICKSLNATTYINAVGGKSLYQTDDFNKVGIELLISAKQPVQYDQIGDEFIDNLSIIDVLMHCSIEQILDMLSNNHSLTPNE
ncbi:MAG: WbqC family protein [Ignavibacteriae bacterium]|nr:WbqC family protein [Ignavibacteriota bacterium]